jgi:enoyl-CoA hydratase/carnithine racemase
MSRIAIEKRGSIGEIRLNRPQVLNAMGRDWLAVMEAFIPGMATWRLPRQIEMGHARHLILSGKDIDPEKAFRIGLVNRVVARSNLKQELQEWAIGTRKSLIRR